MRKLFLILSHPLIQNTLFGLTHLSKPKFLVRILIKLFTKTYRINTDEIQLPLIEYPTLDAYFTRKLKPETRPIDLNPKTLISPVDARVQTITAITDNTLIQAKGIHYTLQQLIPHAFSKEYTDGQAVTLYLSPQDCHCIMAPTDGVITDTIHIPGSLLPVKPAYVEKVPNLYTQNQRLIIRIQTHRGPLCLVCVGAYNVGNISTEYDPQNFPLKYARKTLKNSHYKNPIAIVKGQHIATFHLGSTVIIIVPKNSISLQVTQNQSIRYGMSLGQWPETTH